MRRKKHSHLYKTVLSVGTAIMLSLTLPMSVLADPATDAKKAEQDKMTKKIESLDDSRTKYNEKVRLELIIDKNEVDLENLRAKLKECNRILKDLEKNEEIIRKNNEITAKINVIDATIKEEEAVNRRLSNEIVELRTEYKADAAMIEEKTKTVEIILEEEILVRRWKIYLDIVGKNGIAKMVLRESLPMINGELRRLLDGVCDFDVEVDIDNHNDVTFYKIHDGVKAGLGGGSGFEQTVASLACLVGCQRSASRRLSYSTRCLEALRMRTTTRLRSCTTR